MADLPCTLCFKAPLWMRDRLEKLAEEERRHLGQMVRVIVERYLEGASEENIPGKDGGAGAV